MTFDAFIWGDLRFIFSTLFHGIEMTGCLVDRENEHRSALASILTFCDVTLQLLRSSGGTYCFNLRTWANLVTCFDHRDAVEASSFQGSA